MELAQIIFMFIVAGIAFWTGYSIGTKCKETIDEMEYIEYE